jgi:hypothetical protein
MPNLGQPTFRIHTLILEKERKAKITKIEN